MTQMESSDLSRMNSVLRHRLRNFASGIKSSVVLLSKELEYKISPDLQEYFPLIAAECDNVSKLTDRMSLLFDSDLSYVAATSVTSVHSPDTIAHLMGEMAEMVKIEFPRHRLETEGCRTVMDLKLRDARALSTALWEVVANACEAGSEGQVAMATEQRGDTLVFRVSDRGNGIGPDDFDKVFLPFYTTKSRHIGIGLSITERLVKMKMHGYVEVAPNPDGGVIVEVAVSGQTETVKSEASM